MKDYIDKLREDYHRKQIKKLKFGDKIKAKYNDWKYGTVGSPEIEVGADGKDIPKVITGPTVTTNTGTLSNLNNNQYGLQQTFTPRNTVMSSIESGYGPSGLKPAVSGTIGKTSAIDLTPQQKFINVMSTPDITAAAGKQTSGQIASEQLEKLIEKEGIKPYKIQENQVLKDSELKQEEPKKEEPKKEEQKLPVEQQSPGFFAPPNGDLTTNLYNLGRAIGTKPGTSGRGLAIASNTGAAALEGARALFSGVGFSKAQGYTDQYNQEQMLAARKKYESNPQYGNANYMGGPTQTRNGGRINHFEEGGEQQQMDPRMQQMMAQQQQQPQQGMQEQADPRMQQAMAQEGQQQMDPRMQQQQQEPQMNEQEAQAYQQIAEKLVNSFETIEEIANYLKENEVDEAAYNAILRFAEEMLEDKDESADDNEEATEEPEEKEDMRKGGKKFNKKVGEYIEFEYGGKTYKGTIKSIKNGQIFLK